MRAIAGNETSLDVFGVIEFFPLVFSERQGNTVSRYGGVYWYFGIHDGTRFSLMTWVFKATVHLLLMFDYDYVGEICIMFPVIIYLCFSYFSFQVVFANIV